MMLSFTKIWANFRNLCSHKIFFCQTGFLVYYFLVVLEKYWFYQKWGLPSQRFFFDAQRARRGLRINCALKNSNHTPTLLIFTRLSYHVIWTGPEFWRNNWTLYSRIWCCYFGEVPRRTNGTTSATSGKE